jgi:ribosome maturation factor RimP
MRAEEIAVKVSEQISHEIALMGFDLIEVTFAKGALRLTIDKPLGVTLNDCVAVNKRVGLLLAAEDYIPGSYRLEVSSPGLNRRLTTRKDFEHFTGRMVKVLTKQGVRKGVLRGVEAESLLLETEGFEITIPFIDIVKANLDFDF